MKRMFKGFSLAEVLITLTIIGVISSMTLPALQTNVQKQQAGPAFAKAVNTIQTASRTILQQTGTRNLLQACNGIQDVDKGGFPYCLMNSGVGLFNAETDARVFTKGVGGAAVAMGTCVLGNDGISLCPLADKSKLKGSTTNASLNKRYYGEYYTLYIDTNGPKKPNVVGKDVFLVHLDANGIVLPHGSKAWQDYTKSSDSWEEKCKKTITDADFCAGAIADNSWQVKYNY